MSGNANYETIQDRLRKHISRESGVSNKRHSRGSVGTSEEDIERRAELRRIQKKRILDELSAEGEYDDDAKSLSTVPCGLGSIDKRRATWATGDFLQLMQTPPPLTLHDLARLDSGDAG